MADTLTAPVPTQISGQPAADATHSRKTMGSALAALRKNARNALSFRAVNAKGTPGYDPALQRHHLLPRQLLTHASFGPLFDLLGRDRLGFEDFRSNGLLLPASDSAAIRIGLPMHRGPHRDYNQLVMERMGQVESRWATLRGRAPEIALDEAAARINLLQRALRRRLLNPMRKPLKLNRFDPIGQNINFAEIDAMADMLWGETAVDLTPNPAEMSLIAPGEGSGGARAFSF